MQIVIDIDEEDYEIMKHNNAVNNPLCSLSQEEMVAIVANSTPLPEGHGRLIDADKLKEVYETTEDAECCKWTLYGVTSEIDDAETIVEAESEVEE